MKKNKNISQRWVLTTSRELQFTRTYLSACEIIFKLKYTIYGAKVEHTHTRTHRESATASLSFELLPGIRYQSWICGTWLFNFKKFFFLNPNINVFVHYLECSLGKLKSQAFLQIVQRDLGANHFAFHYFFTSYIDLSQRWENTLLWNKHWKKKKKTLFFSLRNQQTIKNHTEYLILQRIKLVLIRFQACSH